MSKRVWTTLVVLCLTLLGLAATPQPAQAASDYDSLLQTTPNLYVYTDGATKSQTMDISTTWWRDFKQTYQRRLDQNIGFPTDFVPIFENIMQHGSWGVYLEEQAEGNFVRIIGTDDPNSSCGFRGDATAATGYFGCSKGAGYRYINVDYFTHSSYGGNGCMGGYDYRCSDNRMNVYSAPMISTPDSYSYDFFSIANSNLSTRKFFIMNFNVDYPTSYEGVTLPRTQTLNYVALGDSFSSGEGVEPFIDGTDTNTPVENLCHRSQDAYPMLLSEDKSQKVNLKLTAFVACSGATTSNILTAGQYDESRQLDAVNGSTDVVTLTIGGNDMGFSEFAQSCVLANCDEYSTAYATALNNIDNLGNNLENVYATILNKLPPTGRLYVIDYPMMVPMNKTTSDLVDTDCHYLYGGSTVADENVNPWGNGRAAQDVIARLNSKVELSAYNMHDSRVHFVDISTDFEGHDVCSSDSYFINNYLDSGIFHPTAEGIAKMKDAVLSTVEGDAS